MLLRLIAGLTPAEVAEQLDRSVDAVHALQHRARRRLQSELTQSGWAPRGPRRDAVLLLCVFALSSL